VNEEAKGKKTQEEEGYNTVFHDSQPVSDKITSSGNVTTQNIDGGTKAT
jgi:hypothetical protein